MNRRDFLATGGAIGVVALAGCPEDGESGPGTEDDVSPGYTDTETETATQEPEPEYEVTAEVPDEIDYTGSDEAEIELYVERILEEEREVLDPSNVEITNVETVRNHSEHDEDILQDAGLYRQIVEDGQQLQGETISIGSDNFIAGNNTFSLELQYQDPEHDQEDTYTVEQEITVQKNEEETRQDTWIEDQELWGTLREDYVEERLRDTGWIDVAETVEQETDFTQDTQNILEEMSWYWARNAEERVNGRASGQAEYLYQTVEHLSHKRDEMEELHGFKFQNRTHSTAGAYNDERTWNLESSGHEAVSPPTVGRVPGREPEQTPLMNPEGNMLQAESTVQTMAALSTEMNVNDYLHIGEDARVELMGRMREDDNGSYEEETWNTLYNYGLSAALSPEAGLELTVNEL